MKPEINGTVIFYYFTLKLSFRAEPLIAGAQPLIQGYPIDSLQADAVLLDVDISIFNVLFFFMRGDFFFLLTPL